MNKILRIRQAAIEFAQRANQLSSVIEIALFGSLAKGDPYPKDIDLAVVISSLEQLPTLAKYARKMSSFFHNWDVFVFNAEMNYLGRICHRKECPSKKAECFNCGEMPFIHQVEGFIFNNQEFYSSPFEALFKREPESLFVATREKLGIEENREFKKYEDIRLKCWECGEYFVFTGGEQKYYEQQGFSNPKRCEDCRIKKQRMEWGIYDP